MKAHHAAALRSVAFPSLAYLAGWTASVTEAVVLFALDEPPAQISRSPARSRICRPCRNGSRLAFCSC